MLKEYCDEPAARTFGGGTQSVFLALESRQAQGFSKVNSARVQS